MKKNMCKLVSLLLVLVLALCGCNNVEGTVPETTQPVETQAPAITTEADARAALEAGGFVELGADIALSNELVVSNNVLNCGGYTITGPQKVEGDATTENAITVIDGTVENVAVKGVYRGIGDRKGSGANGDVRLKNVNVDCDTYVLNFGYGNGQTGLYVENSTLSGWTSYTKFKEALFTNCTFTWNEGGDNGNLRPYIDTTLVGCKFVGRTEADGTVTPFNIKFKSGSSGVTLVLDNCYVGDTLITQENIQQLLSVEAYGNTITVRNSTT